MAAVAARLALEVTRLLSLFMALVVVTVIAALCVLEPKSLASGLGLNDRAVHAESAIPLSSFGVRLRPRSRTVRTQREQVAVGHFQVDEATT